MALPERGRIASVERAVVETMHAADSRQRKEVDCRLGQRRKMEGPVLKAAIAVDQVCAADACRWIAFEKIDHLPEGVVDHLGVGVEEEDVVGHDKVAG